MNSVNMDKNLLQTCEQKIQKGRDVEEILLFLRDNGMSKVLSVKALAELNIVSFGESKRIVHFSKTWSNVFERDSEFELVLEEAIFETDDKT